MRVCVFKTIIYNNNNNNNIMGSYFSYSYLQNDQWESKQMRHKYFVNEQIKKNDYKLNKHKEPLLFQKIIKKRKRR